MTTIETATRTAPTVIAPTSAWGSLVKGGVIGAALATAGCLAVYAAGNVGAPIRVVTGWTPDGADLTPTEVLATIAVAVVLGTGLLWAMQARLAKAWSVWTLTAATIAIVSAVPLWQLDTDTGSKLALATMHLLTGAAAITGHAMARPRPRQDGHRG